MRQALNINIGMSTYHESKCRGAAGGLDINAADTAELVEEVVHLSLSDVHGKITDVNTCHCN